MYFFLRQAVLFSLNFQNECVNILRFVKRMNACVCVYVVVFLLGLSVLFCTYWSHGSTDTGSCWTPACCKFTFRIRSHFREFSLAVLFLSTIPIGNEQCAMYCTYVHFKTRLKISSKTNINCMAKYNIISNFLLP